MSDIVTGLDADQLTIGIARGPGIWLSPVGTALPTDIDTDFGTGWTSLGYASEDGVTLSTSTDTEDIRAWQALGALRTIITGRTSTVQFQLMQVQNEVNLALYWDIDVPTVGTDGTIEFDVRSDQAGQKHQLAIDVRDGVNDVRVFFPRVTLNAAGDVQFQRSAAILLDVTFSALEDQGRLLRWQSKKGAAATGGGGSPSAFTVEP